MKYNFITKFSKPHFPNIVIKMSWKCDMAENTWITFSSQFLHNVMKTEFCTFLKYNADILYNLLVNSGSHLYEKVMKLWCVKICTHFLAHIIWNLPPCKKVDDHLRWWWRMTVCPGLLWVCEIDFIYGEKISWSCAFISSSSSRNLSK